MRASNEVVEGGGMTSLRTIVAAFCSASTFSEGGVVSSSSSSSSTATAAAPPSPGGGGGSSGSKTASGSLGVDGDETSSLILLNAIIHQRHPSATAIIASTSTLTGALSSMATTLTLSSPSQDPAESAAGEVLTSPLSTSPEGELTHLLRWLVRSSSQSVDDQSAMKSILGCVMCDTVLGNGDDVSVCVCVVVYFVGQLLLDLSFLSLSLSLSHTHTPARAFYKNNNNKLTHAQASPYPETKRGKLRAEAMVGAGGESVIIGAMSSAGAGEEILRLGLRALIALGIKSKTSLILVRFTSSYAPPQTQ